MFKDIDTQEMNKGTHPLIKESITLPNHNQWMSGNNPLPSRS